MRNHSKFGRLALAHFALALMSAEAGVAGTGQAAAPTAPVAETKPPKAEKLIANGVTRPGAGTKTGRVWEIADELSKAAGKPIAREAVMTQAKAEEINEATTATQYGKWRVYNGLKGVSLTEPKPPKAPKAPKQTKAEKAAAAAATAASAGAPVVEGGAPVVEGAAQTAA